jgi:hypothetical protein
MKFVSARANHPGAAHVAKINFAKFASGNGRSYYVKFLPIDCANFLRLCPPRSALQSNCVSRFIIISLYKIAAKTRLYFNLGLMNCKIWLGWALIRVDES